MQSGSEDEQSSSEGEGTDKFIEQHHCTDPLCSVVFWVAVAAFVYVFGWGVAHGSLAKLTHGLDRNGQLCGVSPAVADKPFLYYCPDEWEVWNWTLDVDDDRPICLSACPEGPNASTPITVDCPHGDKAPYATTKVAQWYCLPAKSKFSQATVQLASEIDTWSTSLSNGMLGVSKSWPIMLMTVVVAVILGYVYLCLLRAIAKGLIWLALGLAIAVLVGFGIYLWTQAATQISEHVEDVNISNVQKYSKAFAILSWAIALAVACLVCCCHGEVELSTAAVQTGTEVIWKMPTMVLAPLLKAVAKAFIVCVFFVGFVYLWSTAEVTGIGTHRSYHFTGAQKGYLVLYVVVGVWMLEFVTALYQFSIAYAVAKYYHTEQDEHGERDVECCGVVEGAYCGLVYHSGSLAYGSAIITALQISQRVLEYAEVKNKQEGNNPAVSCILECCLCCCKCLEGIIQFISKNAYIVIAITSNGFCHAVKEVGHIVLDHGAAMALLNGATVVFQIVGMIAITAVCGLLANVVLGTDTFSSQDSPHYVNNSALVTAAACVVGFIVAWAFMAVFDVATDTLLICLTQDKAEHGGHAQRAPERMKLLFDQAEQKAAKQRQEAAARESR